MSKENADGTIDRSTFYEALALAEKSPLDLLMYFIGIGIDEEGNECPFYEKPFVGYSEDGRFAILLDDENNEIYVEALEHTIRFLAEVSYYEEDES